MPMKLINSKSILDCDEIEEEVHNQENNEFIENCSTHLITSVQRCLKELTWMMRILKLQLNHAVYITVLKWWNMSMQKRSRYFNDGGFITFIVYGQHYKKMISFIMFNMQYKSDRSMKIKSMFIFLESDGFYEILCSWFI